MYETSEHEPGEVVEIDELEVPSVLGCVEAVDAAGRRLLDEAQAELDAELEEPAAVAIPESGEPAVVKLVDEEIEAQFDRERAARRGLRAQSKNSDAARVAAEERRVKTETEDRHIRRVALEIRRTHAHDFEHSTRWLAQRIAERLSMKPETVRTRLKKLEIK